MNSKFDFESIRVDVERIARIIRDTANAVRDINERDPDEIEIGKILDDEAIRYIGDLRYYALSGVCSTLEDAGNRLVEAGNALSRIEELFERGCTDWFNEDGVLELEGDTEEETLE